MGISELSALKEITGSLLKALDLFYVMKGARPAARVFLDNERLMPFLEARGIKFELSDFRVLLKNDSSRGFSDSGARVPASEKEGKLVLYASLDRERVLTAKSAEAKGGHEALGRILGYPECCTRFFSENIQKAPSNDLTLHSWMRSGEFHLANNTCLRCFDLCLIPHFPCSFGCGEGRAIAERNLSIIEKSDKDTAGMISNSLKSTVVYSEGIGVYWIRKCSSDGNVIEYNAGDIIPSCRNDFYSLLCAGRIVILGRNRFLVGGVEVNDAHTFIAEFM